MSLAVHPHLTCWQATRTSTRVLRLHQARCLPTTLRSFCAMWGLRQPSRRATGTLTTLMRRWAQGCCLTLCRCLSVIGLRLPDSERTSLFLHQVRGMLVSEKGTLMWPPPAPPPPVVTPKVPYLATHKRITLPPWPHFVLPQSKI